eukprot:COSAG06_NODE_842_length_11986_cov_54.409355_2_plen_92_part_00
MALRFEMQPGSMWLRPPGQSLQKRVSPFRVVSLCLSRACLGEMIIYIHKWHRKKTIFLTGCIQTANNEWQRPFVVRLFPLVGVLSQSWQVD